MAMTWRGSFVAALLATLSHPRWWILALAGFLVRGGAIAILFPIIVPPTVAGAMSSLAPSVLGAILIGGPNTPVGIVVAGTAVVLFVLVSVAAIFGSWFDAELVSEAVADEELGLVGAERAPRPGGLGTARLGPHLVTAVVFALAAGQVFGVAYNEATSPGAPTTPFLARVASQVPGPLLALVVAWLLAEAVGGLALRDLLLDSDEASPRAMWHGLRRLLGARALLTLVVADVIALVIAVPGALAGARAWTQLGVFLANDATAPELAVALVFFVAVVLGWLALLGVALAWRSTVWTAFVARSGAPAAG